MALDTEVATLVLTLEAFHQPDTPALLQALKEFLVLCDDEPFLLKVCDATLRMQVQDCSARLVTLRDAFVQAPNLATLTSLNELLRGKPEDNSVELTAVSGAVLSFATTLPADVEWSEMSQAADTIAALCGSLAVSGMR